MSVAYFYWYYLCFIFIFPLASSCPHVSEPTETDGPRPACPKRGKSWRLDTRWPEWDSSTCLLHGGRSPHERRGHRAGVVGGNRAPECNRPGLNVKSKMSLTDGEISTQDRLDAGRQMRGATILGGNGGYGCGPAVGCT